MLLLPSWIFYGIYHASLVVSHAWNMFIQFKVQLLPLEALPNQLIHFWKWPKIHTRHFPCSLFIVVKHSLDFNLVHYNKSIPCKCLAKLLLIQAHVDMKRMFHTFNLLNSLWKAHPNLCVASHCLWMASINKLCENKLYIITK